MERRHFKDIRRYRLMSGGKKQTGAVVGVDSNEWLVLDCEQLKWMPLSTIMTFVWSFAATAVYQNETARDEGQSRDVSGAA